MKIKNNLFLFSFLSVLTCCSTNEAAGPTTEASPKATTTVTLTPEQNETAGVELGKVEDKVLTGTIDVTGMLDVPPQNVVNVTAPFGGFLRSTVLLQGMHINKGAVIGVVENPEYIQLQQDYLDTRSQVDFLEAEYQRQLELARENINAQKTLQKSEADLNSVKAKNNGLRAKLKMLNIDPQKLGAAAIKSTIEIHSPIDGYVTQVNTSVGSFVNPTDVMFRIVDTDHLHAELVAFERDVPRIRIGQKIRFTLANDSQEKTATVFLIGREIAPDRTIRIHGHLDKEDRDLIPGMYLRASIETGGRAVPALPLEAVINYEDRNFIFVKEGDSGFHYKQIEVKTGVSDDGYIEIISPERSSLLELQVVTKGSYKLLSKMKNMEEGNEPGR
jgi:cobalt-zinc-cadmium efflux system membrane fusion protein